MDGLRDVVAELAVGIDSIDVRPVLKGEEREALREMLGIGVHPLYLRTPTEAPEVSEVTRQLIQRDNAGRAKYGASLDRTDLTTADWLQHMAEELMDAAGYALAAKRAASEPCQPLSESARPTAQPQPTNSIITGERGDGLPVAWLVTDLRNEGFDKEADFIEQLADECAAYPNEKSPPLAQQCRSVQAATIARLTAELDAARVDAERYRKLRNFYGSVNFEPEDHGGMDLIFCVPQGEVSADCDKTIDAIAGAAK